MTMRRGTAILGTLAWLAACSPDAGGGSNSTAVENLAVADNAGDIADASVMQNRVEPTKSILRPEVVEAEPEAPPLERFATVIPFGGSGLKLDEAGMAEVRRALASPAFLAGGAITLRGHTDTRGRDGDNVVASRIRAEAVRDALIAQGVAATRITVVAMGEAAPLAPNARPDGSDDPDARARNRRVEIVVDVPPAASPVPASEPSRDNAIAPVE